MTCTILSAGEELQTAGWNEHEPPMLTIRNRVFELIQSLCMEGCIHFYLNCEYGIPLWAAEFITELKKCNPIQLHVVIPYEEQTTNWPEDFRMLKIGSEHIQYVFDCLARTTTKIANIKAYLLTVLYNAPTTISNYYSTLVRHHMHCIE